MSRAIRLGISTCPNDTFTFHALMTKQVDWRGIEFNVELLDIQTLNERLFDFEAPNKFDVAKASFHAAILLADRFCVLPTGSALGFGVGPLLLSSIANTKPQQASQITLCPGSETTATLLFRLFYPETTRIEQVVFSEIMPRLQTQQADFGVCIHEGRFTWRQQGLHLVEDLGTRWEKETNSPLPLGGIVASKSLPQDLIADVQLVVYDSLKFALENRDDALKTMRAFAQEFDDLVLMQHVDLYVNQWTQELGSVGQRALDELHRRAINAGVVDINWPKLMLFSDKK